MPELAKNITQKSAPQQQLYWFVNKVLSIEKITYLPYGEYDELICFQPNLLKESELFKFRICTYDSGANDGGERENRTLIGIMLMKIKSDVEGNIEKFRKDYGLPSDIEYLIWDAESILLDNAIYIDRKYRPIFEAYLRYLDGDKIETETVLQKKKQIQLPKIPKIIKQNSKDQLYWFVKNFILASKKTVDLGDYEKTICFPVKILSEEKFLFPLGRYGDAVDFKNDDEEYASYCVEMLGKIERDIYLLRNNGLFTGEDKFAWEDDPGRWGYGPAIFMNYSNLPILEAYFQFLNGDKKGNNIVLQKTKKKQLQLPNLPHDLKWGEIIIKFLNGDEVQITAKELVYQTNYELMGFKDQKTKNPNLQWKFFKMLSLKNGYLNWDNNNELSIKQRNNVKKRKQELSETLKTYFTIEDDPFFDYKKENGYKIKIQLIPEQGSDVKDTKKIIFNNLDNSSEDVDPDAQDFFNEQISDSNNW